MEVAKQLQKFASKLPVSELRGGASYRCPQTAKEDEICFFAGFAGEKTLLGLRGLKSENHKSLPVSRKAFVVSNNGRIYIGRGVG